MRSATSFFDKTLFRSQLKHTWPLWLGYTALWLFLVPVALFSALSAYQGGYSASDASYLLLNTGVRGGVFISFVFGLFFAMLAFSHLTQSRATNGFHALPVRRETIFLTAYLTGLFCQVSSILVTFLLGAAVSAPLHLSFWSVTGAAMGSAMLEAVFFYSFAALCMMMTGQILAAPVFYFVGNILVPGMEYLLRNFAGNFLYGYSGHTDVALGFLSPPLYMYTEVSIASIETCESDSYYVTAYALEHRSFMILAAYALAGLVIALIALLLYRTRKSEMTGSTVAFPWATPIFKYGVAFCTAVALGQFLYYFLFGQYRSGGSDSLPGTTLCMAAAGLVGYFVAEMLIKKSFRVFRAGAKGAAIVALALVLLLWYKKKILLLPAAALGIGALFLLPESLQARFLSMLDFSNASASGRFVLWSECLAVWKDHWLLGIGLGPENFSAAYAPYATGLLDFQPPHSNMLYLEMFLSTGIVGGLLFCGFFFGIFVRLRRAVRARPEKRDRWEAQALIAALAGAALGGVPEYIWFYPRILFFWCALFGMALAVSDDN